jgi:hypothetical protein
MVAQIESLIAKGAFGVDFPLECPDGTATVGTNARAMGLAAQGDIPGLEWPLNAKIVPPILTALDLLEFCFMHVAEPRHRTYHAYFSHHHLDFYRGDGRVAFRETMDRLLARNTLAYELDEHGKVKRMAPPILREALAAELIETGDAKLDELLALARARFLEPDSLAHRHALEKLWDAFERVKTLEPGRSKRQSMNALIAKAAPELGFRAVVNAEASALTQVGNGFHIRHSEGNQTDLESDSSVDYLFQRLFALIWFLLDARRG